jgi:organic radical activating enzyme
MDFGKNNIKNIDLILSNNCNLNCFFCNSNNWLTYKWNTKDICMIISKFYKEWFNSITFSGGEPTLDENLFLYIAFAKKLWFTNIKLQTNLLFTEEYFLKLLKSGINLLGVTYLWLEKKTFVSITWNMWKYFTYIASLNYLFKYSDQVDINIDIDIVLNEYIIDNIEAETNKLLKLWFNSFNYKFPFFTWKNRLNYDLILYSEKLKSFLIWKNFNFSILYIPTCYLQWLENHIYDFKNDYIYDFKYYFSLNDSINKIYRKFNECNNCKYFEKCFWFEIGNKNIFKPLT